MLAILFRPFDIFAPTYFSIISLSTLAILSVPDEGYSRNVPDEGYSRNASCTLYSLSTFYL